MEAEEGKEEELMDSRSTDKFLLCLTGVWLALASYLDMITVLAQSLLANINFGLQTSTYLYHHGHTDAETYVSFFADGYDTQHTPFALTIFGSGSACLLLVLPQYTITRNCQVFSFVCR